MGRKKIAMKMIQNDSQRRSTFNKRSVGVIKKAMELSILCNCNISLMIHRNKSKFDEHDLYIYSNKPFEEQLSDFYEFQGEYALFTNDHLHEMIPGKADSRECGYSILKNKQMANNNISNNNSNSNNNHHYIHSDILIDNKSLPPVLKQQKVGHRKQFIHQQPAYTHTSLNNIQGPIPVQTPSHIRQQQQQLYHQQRLQEFLQAQQQMLLSSANYATAPVMTENMSPKLANLFQNLSNSENPSFEQQLDDVCKPEIADGTNGQQLNVNALNMNVGHNQMMMNNNAMQMWNENMINYANNPHFAVNNIGIPVPPHPPWMLFPVMSNNMKDIQHTINMQSIADGANAMNGDQSTNTMSASNTTDMATIVNVDESVDETIHDTIEDSKDRISRKRPHSEIISEVEKENNIVEEPMTKKIKT